VRRLIAPALLLMLAACTGTFELRPPILLAVTFDDGAPQVALIRDNFATTSAGTPRELTFLDTSRRPLPAPAVAIDVVDRAGDRPTLTVLSRETAAPFRGHLSGFDLAGIDPADPTAFAEDADYSRDLTDLLRNQPELADDAEYCLVDLQISRSGRYLALLEDRTVCGAEDVTALYVVDLDDDSLVIAVDTEPLVAAGLYLDQGDDTLHFVVEGVGNAGLERITLGSGDRTVVADITGQEQVDVGRVAAPPGAEGVRLVALSSDSFQAINDDLSPAEVGPELSTEVGARALIADPFELSAQLFILGASRFTVHNSLDADGGRSASVAAGGGTFQPEELFVYLASETRIYIFDALVDDGDGPPSLAPFSLPELITPGPVTWLRGVDSP
jgi:hypothetical protein